MRRILHILTERDRELAGCIIEAQKAETGVQLVIRDIAQGEVDYGELLDQVFEADSVEVW